MSWRLPWRVGLVAAAVGAIAVIVVWPYRDRQQQSPAPLTPVIERETPLVAAAPAASQVTPVEELRQPRRHPAPRPTKPASAEELVPVVAQEDARAFEALLAALRDRNVRLVFDDESTESALAASTLAIPPITIEPLPIDLEGGVEVRLYRFTSIAVALLIAAATVSAAQNPAPLSGPDSPPVARPSRQPLVPLEIQVVIARYQGEKRVSSMPYVLAVNANGERASLNMGADVAIPSGPIAAPVDGKPSPLMSYGYRNVGTNIDCGATTADEGRFDVNISIDDSSVLHEWRTGSRLDGRGQHAGISQLQVAEHAVAKRWADARSTPRQPIASAAKTIRSR